jgi:hypothetical protein
MLDHDPLNHLQISAAEAAAPFEPHGREPELGDVLPTLDVHMLRLISIG